MQGAVLASSNRGGIRVEYSKNPLGRKRDFGGSFSGHGGAPAAPMQSPMQSTPALQSDEAAPMQTAPAASPLPDDVKLEDAGVTPEDAGVKLEDDAPKMEAEPYVEEEEAVKQEEVAEPIDAGAVPYGAC